MPEANDRFTMIVRVFSKLSEMILKRLAGTGSRGHDLTADLAIILRSSSSVTSAKDSSLSVAIGSEWVTGSMIWTSDCRFL